MTVRYLGCLTAAIALGAGVGTSEAATVLIDFGSDAVAEWSTVDSLSRQWNNVVHNNQQPVGGHALLTSENTPSGITLQIGNPVGQAYQSGFNTAGPNTDGLTSASGALAARNYPATALKDSLYGNTSDFLGNIVPGVQLVFSGFNGVAQDLWLYAHRGSVTDNRETRYEIVGATTTVLLFNPTSTDHNQLLVSATNVLPDANDKITINISKGDANNHASGFYYLGVLEMAAVPEPGSIGLLGGGALGLLHRRRTRR